MTNELSDKLNSEEKAVKITKRDLENTRLRKDIVALYAKARNEGYLCAGLATFSSALGVKIIHLTYTCAPYLSDGLLEKIVEPAGYIFGASVVVGGIAGAVVNVRRAIRSQRALKKV